MHIYGRKLQSRLAYISNIIHTEGFGGLVTKLKHKLQLLASQVAARVTPRPPKFSFQNREYDYISSPYNTTTYNERSAEIAIALHQISLFSPKQILEVGNVISHYQSVKHLIVDKFESARGVINQDILDYKPKRKFDLIISISTLEHVGFDDDEHNPQKILQTIIHLKSLLKKGGTLFFTLPIGYNPAVDKLLSTQFQQFDKLNFLRRISWNNQWQQASFAEVKDTSFSSHYYCANAIAVGTVNAD